MNIILEHKKKYHKVMKELRKNYHKRVYYYNEKNSKSLRRNYLWYGFNELNNNSLLIVSFGKKKCITSIVEKNNQYKINKII